MNALVSPTRDSLSTEGVDHVMGESSCSLCYN